MSADFKQLRKNLWNVKKTKTCPGAAVHILPVQEKASAANVLPTTANQGSFPRVSLMKKRKRPTTGHMNFSHQWFRKEKFKYPLKVKPL